MCVCARSVRVLCVCRPCCRATFEFEGQDSTELSFSTGDFINIVGREDADWLKGQLNGKEGIFPDAFVDILKDIAVGETFGEWLAICEVFADKLETFLHNLLQTFAYHQEHLPPFSYWSLYCTFNFLIN